MEGEQEQGNIGGSGAQSLVITRVEGEGDHGTEGAGENKEEKKKKRSMANSRRWIREKKKHRKWEQGTEGVREHIR